MGKFCRLRSFQFYDKLDYRKKNMQPLWHKTAFTEQSRIRMVQLRYAYAHVINKFNLVYSPNIVSFSGNKANLPTKYCQLLPGSSWKNSTLHITGIRIHEIASHFFIKKPFDAYSIISTLESQFVHTE